MTIESAISILNHAYDWCIEKKHDQEYIGRAIYMAIVNLRDVQEVSTALPDMQGKTLPDDSRATTENNHQGS